MNCYSFAFFFFASTRFSLYFTSLGSRLRPCMVEAKEREREREREREKEREREREREREKG